MPKNETISWWKSFFSNSDFSDIPSSCPTVKEALEIWSKIAPVIFANSNSHDEGPVYWKSVREIVQKLTGKTEIPDPQTDLSGFWDFLYEFRDIIFPKKPEDCLPYINNFCPSPSGDFFVLDFPRSINNPMLALRTYQFLHNSNHPKWIQFIHENGAIGRLMDYYLPFLTPLVGQFDKMYWRYRLEMCDLIVSLVIANFDSIPLADGFVVSLNSKITAIISDAPLEYVVDFVRFAIQINKISLPRIRPEAATKRILNLLGAAPPGTVAHAPLVRFAYKIASDFVTTESLAKYLINQGVTCSYDLEILATIAVIPNSTAQMPVICQLARVMTLDPIYARTASLLFAKVATKAIDKILPPKPDKEGDVVDNPGKKESPTETITPKEWIIKFIRRLSFFIGLANAKKRYSGRICRIAELLTHPDLQNIPWLKDEINKNISILINSNLSPEYFSQIFEKVAVSEDSQWKTEYDIFEKEHVNLKRFPFGASGNTLLETNETKPKPKPKAKPKEKKGPAKKGKASKPADAKEKRDESDKDTEDNNQKKKKRVRRPKWKP